MTVREMVDVPRRYLAWPRTALGNVVDVRLSSVDKKVQLDERSVRVFV